MKERTDITAALVWAGIILVVVMFWMFTITFVVRAIASGPKAPRCVESAVQPSHDTYGIGSAIVCTSR